MTRRAVRVDRTERRAMLMTSVLEAVYLIDQAIIDVTNDPEVTWNTLNYPNDAGAIARLVTAKRHLLKEDF